eukprot:COSAG02_NODE_3846_length_6153_cov_1.953089_9_plen_169_part_00
MLSAYARGRRARAGAVRSIQCAAVCRWASMAASRFLTAVLLLQAEAAAVIYGSAGARSLQEAVSSTTCVPGDNDISRQSMAVEAACCVASSAGHRRTLQDAPTCDLPDTCATLECAQLFVEFYESCGPVLESSGLDVRSEFGEFYTQCSEVAALGPCAPSEIDCGTRH